MVIIVKVFPERVRTGSRNRLGYKKRRSFHCTYYMNERDERYTQSKDTKRIMQGHKQVVAILEK